MPRNDTYGYPKVCYSTTVVSRFKKVIKYVLVRILPRSKQFENAVPTVPVFVKTTAQTQPAPALSKHNMQTHAPTYGGMQKQANTRGLLNIALRLPEMLPMLLLLLLLLLLLGSAPDTARALRCPRGAHLQSSTPVATFPNTELTFEAWVWLGNGTAGLIEYSTKDALQNAVSTFAVAASASAVAVSVHGAPATVSLPSEHALAIAAETWTHVAVTWKTESGKLRVYVDGAVAEDASAALSDAKGVFMQSGGDLRLGKFSDTVSLSYADDDVNKNKINLMEEARIWSKAFGERHVLQILRRKNLPSFTDLYGHWRLWGNASSDLYDLAGPSTSRDVSMTLVANGAGENCLDVAATRAVTAKRPGNYRSEAYSDMELLGTGMASGKQYALDTGTSILVSSFGDSNTIVARSGETGEVVSTAEVQNQGVAKLSGITSGDSIEATGGCQGISVPRDPRMPLVPRAFQGSTFVLPNIRGWKDLYITVKSLANDLTEAESGEMDAGLSSEVVNATVHSTVKSADFFQTSTKCSKLVIDAIPSGSDNSAGNYRLRNAVDNDPDTYWETGKKSLPGGGSAWFITADFGTKVHVDRYSFTVGTATRSGAYTHPTQWMLRASDDNNVWTTIDTVDIHSGHNWQLQETRLFWGVGGSTSKDTRSSTYRYWRLQFTRTNGGRNVRLHEINFFSCGDDLTPGLSITSPDSPKALTVKKSDILSFQATVNTVGGSSPTVSVAASAGETSWAYSDKWSCTSKVPAWYWNLPDFEQIDIDSDSDWNNLVADEDITLTPASGKVTIWPGTAGTSAGQKIWCRVYLGNSPDTLTLWDSSTSGNHQIEQISPGGVVRFIMRRGAYDSRDYQVLQASTKVVVASMAEGIDARGLPAASTMLLGFASQRADIAPAYKDTSAKIYRFQDTMYDWVLNGGLDAEGNMVAGDIRQLRGAGQYECRAAMFIEATNVIGGASFMDKDGIEAVPLLPIEFLSSEYVVPDECEYVSFSTVRPDSADGAVSLDIYWPDGTLRERITTFKRHADYQNTAQADDGLRPSCFNYYPASGGIPGGTRFVADYPVYMVYEEKAKDDETFGAGRGSWVWAKVSATSLRVVENAADGPGSDIATYTVKFATHDESGKLGWLGRPKEGTRVKVTITSDAQVTVNPSVLNFNHSNWLDAQTVTVTANTDYLVEDLVRTSVIRHTIDSDDVNYASGRVSIPDVNVDTVNIDFNAVPGTPSVVGIPTGGLIKVKWSAPDAAKQADLSGSYNYALEMSSAPLPDPTIIQANMSCDAAGCSASTLVSFDLEEDQTLRAAALTIRVRQTDFDADAAVVERLTIDGVTVRANCNPGGPKVGGGVCGHQQYANSPSMVPACVGGDTPYQLNASALMASRDENGKASITISGKISPAVKVNDCMDTEVPLFFADIKLELTYASDAEVYFGPLLEWEQADLIHSTKYNIRVASSSPEGIFSSYSSVASGATSTPTAPTAPRDLTLLSSTGGSINVDWRRPKDTGGALLVDYFVSANQIAGTYLHGDSDFHSIAHTHAHDHIQPSLPRQTTSVYALRPFADYNVSLYATNEVEFCEGPGPACMNVTMKTLRPSLPSAPRSIIQTAAKPATGGAIFVDIMYPLQRGGHESLSYDIAWREIGGATWHYDYAQEGPQAASSTLTQKAVYGLTPGKTYDIKARAVVPVDTEGSLVQSSTGCVCDFDKSRTDCACCVSGAVQCGREHRHMCVHASDVKSFACGNDVTATRMNRALRIAPESTVNFAARASTAWAASTATYNLFSFEAWVRLADANVTAFTLLELASDGEGETITLEFHSGSFGKGKFRLKQKGGSEQNVETVASVDVLSAWVHVAATRDSNSKANLYIDGFPVAGNAATLNVDLKSTVAASAKFSIGAMSSAGVLLDDVRLWRGVERSLSKIRSQMATPLDFSSEPTDTIALTFADQAYVLKAGSLSCRRAHASPVPGRHCSLRARKHRLPHP